MKSFCLALLTLVFMGCSGGNEGPTDYGPYPAPGGISEDIEPFVRDFEGIYNVSITYAVIFDDENETGGSNPSGGTTVGVCRVWTNGKREVLVNRAWWNSKGTLPRRLLIYHELGHCSFDRDHEDRDYSNGMPFSIMKPILNPVITWYTSHANYYLGEMTSPIPGAVADNSSPPAPMAAGYEEEGVVNVKEYHTLGSSHAEHLGCEGHDKVYELPEEK